MNQACALEFNYLECDGRASLWPSAPSIELYRSNATEQCEAGMVRGFELLLLNGWQNEAAPGRRGPKRRQAGALQGITSIQDSS